jgi:hypothetical protein
MPVARSTEERLQPWLIGLAVIFWKAYRLMRDAESARLALKDIPKDDPDKASFESLYSGLLKQLYTELIALSEVLDRERFWFRLFRTVT